MQASYYNGEYRGTGDRPSEYYKASVVLNYALYNGGADMNAKRKIMEKSEQKAALQDKTKRDIEHKLKSVYDIRGMAQNKLKLLDTYIQSKETTLQMYEAHFLIAKAFLRDILDTTDSLYAAKKMLVDAKISLYLSEYGILEAMGSLPKIEYHDQITLITSTIGKTEQ